MLLHNQLLSCTHLFMFEILHLGEDVSLPLLEDGELVCEEGHILGCSLLLTAVKQHIEPSL